MALGFLGVLKVMTWLKQSPQENVISASSPSFKIKVDSKLQEVQEDPSSSAASGDNHSNPKN